MAPTVQTDDDTAMDEVWESTIEYALLMFRGIAAVYIVWYSGSVNSNHRLFSGWLTAVTSSVLTFTFLDILFLGVGMQLAEVALYIMAVNSTLVGMSLGILLPKFFPGVCLGAEVALLVVSFVSAPASVPSDVYFPALAGSLIAIFSLLSLRASTFVISLATALMGGGIAACLANVDLFPYLMNVARGYQLLTPMSTFTDTQPVNLTLGLEWVAGSIVTAILMVYRDGNFRSFDLLSQFRMENGTISSQSASTPKRQVMAPMYARDQPTPASPDAYNMFDPADLPRRLGEYANMVYSACEDLGNFFGFQDSSVRNQAEHLLILLSNNRRYLGSNILDVRVRPPSPVHALHAKVFSNYMKWCKAMGVKPHFSKMNSPMSAPPALASRVVDLVLFFCIWGEGANIRHMPECMWFLYHKMMAEYTKTDGYTQSRSLYAGYFVDNVVSPVYEIVEKNMQSKVDHQDKRNYDDFNEFFWSRKCLRYRYSSETPPDVTDVEGTAGVAGPVLGDNFPPIVEGLLAAPKTFLEKRSWFRGILAMNRIIEWHIVSFYLLSVVAFSYELVWGWVYTCQVGSGVFWIFNSLHLFWGLLEVWSMYPGIQLTGTAVCGSVFTLLARFLILVYQTLYLMWTFGPAGGEHLGLAETRNFWWWQYLWLSLLCMTPYLIEATMQLYPSLTTRMYMSQNDFVQSFLNILDPLSRLYVGKEVHESFRHTAGYVFYWATLICWKLYFSFIFEVYSMVQPTLQLTDDFLNYPNQSFVKMSSLLVLRWTPQFIVYCIDMSIWYAVWQAFAGTSVGFSDRLGDIRSIEDIRQNFGRAPEHFCQKMLSADAGSRRGSSASFLQTSNADMTNNNTETQSLLGTDPKRLQSYVNRLLDVRVQKWVMFSVAWNKIIDHFRQEDIISNRERDYLKFSTFDGFSQAIYLPVFQTAGIIENALTELERPSDEYTSRLGLVTDDKLFKPILDHVTMKTAVSEVWELGSYIFVQLLGSIHNNDVVAIMNLILKWTEEGNMVQHLRMEKIRSVVNNFVEVVKILQKGIGRRKPASKKRSTGKKVVRQEMRRPVVSGIRRSISASSLSGSSLQSKAEKGSEPEKSTAVVVVADALRDQVRDKFRAMAHAIKGLLKNAEHDNESRDLVDRITFLLSMENGFLWDDAYASDQLDNVCKNQTFKEVLTKIHGLVACHPDDAEPKSKEARRRLTFFVNTLFMDIPEAPSIKDMFSWNVITPYYSEDVTYTKGDLERRSDELGVSTLLYLQTLYRLDWNNFLERMGITDDEKIWSSKIMNETRTWASIRSQTLSRTVSGMMYGETALRLLANLERHDESSTNDLISEKFGYVVSCQVYGNMKKNQDSKAEDIDQLMHRYPHLRVAYIDSVRLNRSGASVFYSVLVKSDGRGKIQEIYRVRLPGNPVLGEGKPENQNHAMIFTRGEYLQTIDMNQEGYFEEALKMRNVLQEFAKRDGPLPTTIIGLREHIFTGSVSSLANYMALQETSFVTLGQRVLAKPLYIRLHYGHPDIFDKLFFITRGGISKSSKGINLSEDIFAGYNNLIRGGQVGFKEYVQVGKGRDVGMTQIYKFEAKLSQGAGEQSLSRDVYRCSHRLDFTRFLSMFYGGIGHYFSNVLTVLTIYIVIYLMTILALFDLEKIGNRTITPMGTIQMLLGGLGLLQTIPLFATLGVERGWWPSLKEIFHVFITGGPLHFMFHIQTKCNYMSQTILVGGAKYRATGRGFVTQHTPMDENFRFFASSHLYLGVEMAAGLLLMGMFTEAKQYFGRTWSLWLASVSFVASPFWFNPLTFDWNVVCSDYDLWVRWMRGHTGGPSKSWSMWWVEENSFYKTIPMTSKMVFVSKTVLYLVIANGIRTSDLMVDSGLSKPAVSVSRVLIFIGALLVLSRVFVATEKTLPYPVRRTIGIVISVGVVAGIVTVFLEDTDAIRYTLAAYYAIGALCMLGLVTGVKSVKHFYFIHDLVVGHIIFIPLFILAALQIPKYIQTWLLYHNALSTDVVVDDILRYARKTQTASSGNEQNEDLIEQVSELKKLVQKQEQILMNAGLVPKTTTLGGGSNPSTDAIASLVAPGKDTLRIQPSAPVVSSGLPGRTLSMSGLDVWGDMALGDSGQSAEPQRMYQNADHMVETRVELPSGTQGFQFSQPDTMPPR